MTSLPHLYRSRHSAGVIVLLAVCAGAPGALMGQDPVPVPDTISRSEPTARAGGTAHGGGIESGLLPRGALQFQITASNTAARSLYDDGGRRLMGEGRFIVSELGTSRLPELVPVEERLRALMTEGTDWRVNLGATAGRFESDEQRVHLRAGYGILDRLSVGVTVPMVRRRLASVLTLAGTGATAGTNPSASDPSAVSDFLAGTSQGLDSLEARVAEECAAEGDRCEEGQELVSRATAFLQALQAAYEEEIVFPLRGSSGADGVLNRWQALRTGLAEWEVDGPEAPPLASAPLDPQDFAARFVEPAWGADGFPLETPQEFMEVGDVEAHLVLGLLDLGGPDAALGVRSSLLASARFATGAVDSLQSLTGHHPPGGVSGYGLRLVTDVISAARLAVLGVVEAWTYGHAESTVLAPASAPVLGADAVTRLPVRWSPGNAFRLRISPRAHVTPSLSLGVGYELDRRGEATFEPGPEGDQSVDGWTTASSRLQRLGVELRYHGGEEPVVEALPFPLEVMLAFDRTVAGSGPMAPVEQRIRLGVRVLRRR